MEKEEWGDRRSGDIGVEKEEWGYSRSGEIGAVGDGVKRHVEIDKEILKKSLGGQRNYCIAIQRGGKRLMQSVRKID